MKILRITFENIHSLQGRQEVDWEKAPLKGEGLFIISGPTGAGKSTLLDIMTLALYNRIARLSVLSTSVIESTGSVVTHGCTSAFAEIVYRCAKGTFRSRWSIEKKKGVFGDYKMELWSDSQNQKIESLSSKVQKLNEELVGLDYQQFCRAIMLAQGDFAQFLKAKKNERSELLEKITGTAIFSQIGKKCAEIESSLKQELHDLDVKLKAYRLLSAEERSEKEKKYEEVKRKKELTEFQFAKYSKQKQLLQKQTEFLEKLSAQKATCEMMEEEMRKFQADHEMAISIYQRLRPLAELISNFLKVQDAHLEMQRQKKASDDLAEKLELLRGQWLQELSLFIPGFDNTKNEEEQLLEFRNQVLMQENELSGLLERRPDNEKKLKELFAKVDPEFKGLMVKESQTSLQNFEQAHAVLLVKIESLKNELQQSWKQDPEDTLEQFRNRERGLIALIERIEVFTSRDEDIKLLKASISEVKFGLQQILKEYEKEGVKRELLQTSVIRLRERLQKQEVSKSLEEHRKQLKPGDPCPLCGSEEHPFVRHYEELLDELSKDLKREENLLKEASQAEAQLLTQKSKLEEASKQKEEQLAKLEADRKVIALSINALKEEYAFDFSYAQDREWPSRNLGQVKKDIQVLSAYLLFNKQELFLREISLGLKEFLELKNEIERVEARNKSFYNGEPIVRRTDSLRTRWTILSEKIQSNKIQKDELERQLPNLTNKLVLLQSQLEEELNQAGFVSLDVALQSKITEEEYLRLQELQQQLTIRLSTAHESLKQVQADFNTLDLSGIDGGLAEVTLKVDQLAAERDNYLREAGAVESELLMDARHRQTQEKELLDFAEKTQQHKKWQALSFIIGDKEGRTFRNAAQRLTLQQLIWQANLHLAQLYDRYEFEMPSKDSRTDELRVIDKHMANTLRSVNTLSGGETFLASLAMALGLSDMASRDTKLESLFIDEGFGTLDSESLEIAINTLENLQIKQNKVIGVISHIEAMKERIPVKIQVDRNADGYSTIHVVR